ncbi:BON domain-containing protein [Pseudomonas sp. Ga0074129]|uniref:BON domain-containing protein n=1 Tax=Pseudomonas sp. Ga0074129 TaxID=1752219 RepID=UPI000AF91B67|nr:BON domain-containing protein [Pseudomonas sp. Ga0074129]
MHKQSRNLFLASALALAVTGTSLTAGAQESSQAIMDARQEAQVSTTYALSPYLRANDINVKVVNGKATLTGHVAEEVHKDLATEIAMGVKGVTDVDNQIVVDADYLPPKPGAERGFGDVISDASITTAVKSKLVWSKSTDGMSTQVETRFGRVVLRGTAQSAVERDLAGRLALNTHGVVAVDNQLKVNAQKPDAAESGKQAVKEAGVDISDSWITTKVKSSLLYTSNVAGSAIEVSTDKGVVSLSGRLNSSVEKALAVEVAQNVRGVKSVKSAELVF